MENYFTISQAAKLIGVSSETLRRWENTGKFPSQRHPINNYRVYKDEHIEIAINKMKAKERMILGIPLDPDAMDLADWDSLPGIGSRLAKSIVDDRHKNGDFGSVEALKRVPGVGEGKLKGIIKYF